MSLTITNATDINNHPIRVFIDLYRKVGAVDRGIHVNNIDCIVVRRLGNDLIKSHFENGMQLSMKSMDVLRELFGITTGMQQRSISGHIRFLLHIRYTFNEKKPCKIDRFAGCGDRLHACYYYYY